MDQSQQPPTAAGGSGDIRVLIADRSAHYRETVRRVLRRYSNCAVVGEASTLNEAVARVTESTPDLVLLDFDLVVHESVTRLRRIVETFPLLRVVVLLDDYSQDYRQAVLDRWGYLCVAKDRVEEQLTWIIADISPGPVRT